MFHFHGIFTLDIDGIPGYYSTDFKYYSNIMNKREQKRQSILVVAQQIFSRLGLAKTTMDEIARAARIGKATLYHYFRDKEQLFYEVVRQETKTMKDAINGALKDVANPRERLRIYINIRLETLKRFVITYSALRDEYLGNLSSVKEFRADFQDYENRMLASIFRDGMDKKIFAVMNINEIIRIFSMALRGMELYMFTDSVAEINKPEIDLLTDTLLYGICK
jgi:AcrR family transcriptional regulator